MPLLLAASSGEVYVVSLLLSHRADVNACDAEVRVTDPHVASMFTESSLLHIIAHEADIVDRLKS